MDGGTQPRPRRAQVLDTLRAAPAPLGVAEVARRVGVHVNTARFHLDALAADGSVVRTSVPPSGPGRPRTVYAPRPGMDRGGARGYGLLARVLMGRLAAAGAAGRAEAEEAGREWGRFLVDRPSPHQRIGDAEAAGRLTALLAGLDFAPEPAPHPGDGPGDGPGPDHGPGPGRDAAPSAVRLRHCPFLELAEEYGSFVCRVHLGLMRGALAELGAGLTATRLEPFAEPDVCVAHLGPAPRPASPATQAESPPRGPRTPDGPDSRESGGSTPTPETPRTSSTPSTPSTPNTSERRPPR